MNYSHDHDHHDVDVLAGKDHELTLSTAAIFGIFFGLVVLCGIFFGFGYSLGGHKSTGSLPSESAASTPANFNAFKPAAGQPAGSHTDAPISTRVASVPANPQPATDPSALPADTAPAVTPVPVVRTAPAAAAAPHVIPVPPISAPTPVATGNLQVQVAAISINHQEDATLLMNALRAKGYAVTAHPEPDNFIHLLIGPFNNRPAAEAMRQHLLTDGYTAYIK
jgi:DedD protein